MTKDSLCMKCNREVERQKKEEEKALKIKMQEMAEKRRAEEEAERQKHTALRKEEWNQRIPMQNGNPTTAEMFIVAPPFGGGMAMLPILQREVVENKHWATEEELVDYFAIGQCTPGVIAVNTATFIGQKRRGIIGGIVATLGVVFPSLIIIAALAGVIDAFSHLAWVQHAFAGIRVCVCVLIFNAVLKLWKGAVKDVWGLVIFLVILALSVFTKLSPIIYVLAAAVAGLLIKNLGAKRS